MKAKYFDIVEKVVESVDAPACGQSSVRQCDNRVPSHSWPEAMLVSPTKKRKEDLQLVAAGEARYLTVFDLHVNAVASTDNHAVECFLLFMPEEARWVEVKNRTTHVVEQVPVISLLLTDFIGPVVLECWRECAEKVVQDFGNWQASGAGAPMLLDVKFFWLRGDAKMHCMTPFRKMGSSDKTVITHAPSPTLESTRGLKGVLDNALFTRDFSLLDKAPPFRLSVAGIVKNVEPGYVSQAGYPMQSFELHDCHGRFVVCQAYGRHVDNPGVVDNNEVVLYFVIAQTGLAGGPGCLRLYDESHVAKLRSHCLAPTGRNQMLSCK